MFNALNFWQKPKEDPRTEEIIKQYQGYNPFKGMPLGPVAGMAGMPIAPVVPVAPPEPKVGTNEIKRLADLVGSTAGKMADSKPASKGSGKLPFQGLIDLVGKLGSLAQSYQKPERSIEDIYNDLRQQYGKVEYNGPSAADMVAREFDPQFKLLDQIGKQTEGRYNTGKSQIEQMYNTLHNATLKSRDHLQAQGKATGQEINDNYAAASQNLTGNFTDSTAKTAELLASLGVLEGQDKLANDSQSEMAKQLGYLTQNQQAATNLNSQTTQNRYAYDTERADNVRGAGALSQQDFLQQYLDKQNQNDMARLDLQGQRGRAENTYGMQIQDLLNSMQGNVNQSLDGQIKAILDERKQRDNNTFRQAELNLSQDRFGLDKDKFLASQNQEQQGFKDPYAVIREVALGQYGGNEVNARRASDVVLDAFLKHGGNFGNPYEFLNSFEPGQFDSDPRLKPLAFQFISEMLRNNLLR